MRVVVTKLTSVRNPRGTLVVMQPGERVSDRGVSTATEDSVVDEVANLKRVLGEKAYKDLVRSGVLVEVLDADPAPPVPDAA